MAVEFGGEYPIAFLGKRGSMDKTNTGVTP